MSLRKLADTYSRISKADDDPDDDLNGFVEWFEGNLDFAAVDIAEGSETPMEQVDMSSVVQKYRKYLAECLDEIELEISEDDPPYATQPIP
jgi:hypothetical protein